MKPGWLRAFRLASPERDVEEEFAFHRERTVEDLMAEEGLSREAAEAEAARRFGDERRWRRELERVNREMAARRRLADGLRTGWEVIGGAARRLTRRPGLAAGIALTFALGVGANAVMFGMVDRVLLSPPDHVAEPDRVKQLMVNRFNRFTDTRTTRDQWTYQDFRTLEQVGSLASVAAYSSRDVVVGHGPEAREVQAVLVTGDFFTTLGVAPAVGRFFTPAEDVRGGPRHVVLSWSYWQRVHGGDPEILGSTVAMADGPYTVIGVTPRGFTGVDLAGVDLWLPLHVTAFPGLPLESWMSNPWWFWLRVVGRLAPEVTAVRAETEATTLHRGARREMIEAGDYDAEARVVAASLIAAQGPLASDESRVVRWLVGVSLVVLLIAAFNVANLLLARTSEQRRELGVRMALGISRRRLAGGMLAEGALLALVGGGAALVVAVVGGSALQRALLPTVAWGNPITPRLVLFTLALALVAGLAAALLPTLLALRGRVGEALRSGGRGTVTGSSGVRRTLTAAQAAFSVLLLAGAGLFVRSLDHASHQDLGLETEGLVVVIPQGASDLPTPERRQVMMEAERRIESLPGVERAALGGWTRLLGGMLFDDIRVPGRDSIPGIVGRTPAATLADPDYMATVGLRLAAGRWIRDTDVAGAAPVAVVNRAFADLVFDAPDDRALGQCFHFGDGPCRQVVGVVQTAMVTSPSESARPQFFIPLAQRSDASPQVAYARLAPGADGALAAIRDAFYDASPAIRFVDAQRATDLLAPHRRPWRLGATLFSAFGLLALVVAGIGLYSLLAYEVARRAPEIGIRAALGATRQRLVRSVVGDALRVVAGGLALGLAAAWFLAPRIEDLLFQVPARDPATLSVVAVVLLAVALTAAGVPALRASRVDPNLALRED